LVAATGNGDEEFVSGLICGLIIRLIAYPVVSWISSESFAKQEYVLAEVALFDVRTKPKCVHQLVFCDHALRVLEEEDKQVERTWTDRDYLTCAAEGTMREVNLEVDESVLALFPGWHSEVEEITMLRDGLDDATANP
jgi:hypothetical protein